MTAQKFTTLADEALYRAKAKGRNRAEQHMAGISPSSNVRAS